MKDLVVAAYWLAAMQSLLLAAIGYVVIGITLHGYSAVLTRAFLLVFLPINLLQRYALAIVQGRGQFKNVALAIVSVQVAYALLVLALFVSGVADVRYVLGALVIGNVVALAIALRSLHFLVGLQRVTLRLFRDTFTYGLKGHLGNLAPIELLQVDLLIVASLLGPYQAGLYTVGVSAAAIIRFTGFAIGMVALPHVATAGSVHAQHETVGSMFRLALVLIVTIAVPLEVTVPQLIRLVYGTPFVASASVARILIAAAVFASLRRTLGDCLRGLGYPLKATLAELAGWAAGLALLPVLVPRFGALGVATGVTVAFAASLIVLVGFALKWGIRPLLLLRPTAQDLRLASRVFMEMLVLMRTSHKRSPAGATLLRDPQTDDIDRSQQLP